jgi:hypothetical protein
VSSIVMSSTAWGTEYSGRDDPISKSFYVLRDHFYDFFHLLDDNCWFWLPLCYLQTLLIISKLDSSIVHASLLVTATDSCWHDW